MMMRAINDAYNVREFMEQQKTQVTQVALLRQWKNLEAPSPPVPAPASNPPLRRLSEWI